MRIVDDLWQELQDLEWNMYKESPIGVFSVDGLKGAEVTGKVINEYIPYKNCLDVGCGALLKPYYMKVADKVKFTGIDPYEADREFTFKQGYAEDIEYPNRFFHGVLFATSLDHVKDPHRAISEAYRVLKDSGYLFIWISIRKNNWRYKLWKLKGVPSKYDKYHILAFTHDDLMRLTNKFNLIEMVTVHKLERVYIFKK